MCHGLASGMGKFWVCVHVERVDELIMWNYSVTCSLLKDTVISRSSDSHEPLNELKSWHPKFLYLYLPCIFGHWMKILTLSKSQYSRILSALNHVRIFNLSRFPLDPIAEKILTWFNGRIIHRRSKAWSIRGANNDSKTMNKSMKENICSTYIRSATQMATSKENCLKINCHPQYCISNDRRW